MTHTHNAGVVQAEPSAAGMATVPVSGSGNTPVEGPVGEAGNTPAAVLVSETGNTPAEGPASGAGNTPAVGAARGAGNTSAPGLARMQQSWSDYFRAPSRVARPAGTVPRRIDAYVELLRNNIGGFIHQCFPISGASVEADRWEGLIDEFFSQGKWHHSPFFHEIPKAFVVFLQSQKEFAQGEEEAPAAEDDADAVSRQDRATAAQAGLTRGMHDAGVHAEAGTAENAVAAGVDDAQASLPAWLAELAHYEWLELAVETAPDVPLTFGPQGLALNTTLQLEGYAWPVHTIQAGATEVAQDTTFVAVYRDREHRVRFTVLTPAAAQLLSVLQHNGCDWDGACSQLAAQWGMTVADMAAGVAPLKAQWVADELLAAGQGPVAQDADACV